MDMYNYDNYTANFNFCKIVNFQLKMFSVCIIFAYNIDCGYSLEPVLTCSQNLCFRAKIRKMYTPVNPRFTIQKWDVKGYELHGCVTMMLN